MELIGYRTESVYRRYDVMAERGLEDVVTGYSAGLQSRELSPGVFRR
jgi:hypothetical protein